MLGNGNGIYFTGRHGGPCWSRDQGYHTPKPLPAHIVRIITAPKKTRRRKKPVTR